MYIYIVYDTVSFMIPYIKGEKFILHENGTKIKQVDLELSKIKERLQTLEAKRSKK